MAGLHISYEGKEYDLDLEDMDTDEARAIERYGIPNLLELETGIASGNISALTALYWLMLRQNGEPGARIDHVKFKPLKLVKALMAAAPDEAEAPKAGARRSTKLGSNG